MKSRMTAKDQLALAEVINKDYNNLATDKDRQAFAEVIVQELKEDIMHDNLFDILGVETKTFGFNETMQFKTTRGCKAYIHEPGSPVPRSSFQNRIHTLDAELIGTHPVLELGEIQSGRYGDIADIRQFANEALIGKTHAILWNTLFNSIASTAANYITIAASATANAKVEAISSGIEYVVDVPGSREVAIVGRRSALKFLAKHDAYVPATYNGPSDRKMQELDYALYPGTFRGVPIVMLNQYEDGWGMNNIDSNEIMILGLNTLKMGIKEELGVKQWEDGEKLEWHLHLYTRRGFAVFFPERNFRIHLT